MRIAMLARSNAPRTPLYALFFIAEGHAVCVLSFHPQQNDGVGSRYFGVELVSALGRALDDPDIRYRAAAENDRTVDRRADFAANDRRLF